MQVCRVFQGTSSHLHTHDLQWPYTNTYTLILSQTTSMKPGVGVLAFQRTKHKSLLVVFGAYSRVRDTLKSKLLCLNFSPGGGKMARVALSYARAHEGALREI